MNDRHLIATFDLVRFRDDVRAYLAAQRLSPRDLADRTGLQVDRVRRFLADTPSLGLGAAVAVAHVCDLTLDSYVKVQAHAL